MKKFGHKNQVVISTLALLLAIVGYISYDKSTADKELEVASVNSTQLEVELDTQETMNPGETILTSAIAENASYAAEVKLNREQVRSKNKESLLEIINNDSLTDEQKQTAIDEMVAMADIAEKEADAEMLLEAKGFTNVVVSVVEDSCDVVLDMGEVSDAKMAQVEDIVKRKTGIAAENIVITTLNNK